MEGAELRHQDSVRPGKDDRHFVEAPQIPFHVIPRLRLKNGLSTSRSEPASVMQRFGSLPRRARAPPDQQR